MNKSSITLIVICVFLLLICIANIFYISIVVESNEKVEIYKLPLPLVIFMSIIAIIILLFVIRFIINSSNDTSQGQDAVGGKD